MAVKKKTWKEESVEEVVDKGKKEFKKEVERAVDPVLLELAERVDKIEHALIMIASTSSERTRLALNQILDIDS